MKRNVARLLFVPFIAGAALAVTAGPSAFAATRPSATVTIQMPPDGMSFKDGPNVTLVRANCVTCHSAEYVYRQPPLSKAQWLAEVTKMQKAYKAPIPDDAVDPIVLYLLTQNGKP
jgi:cytochrome c5